MQLFISPTQIFINDQKNEVYFSQICFGPFSLENPLYFSKNTQQRSG